MLSFTLTETQQKCHQLQYESTELHNGALEQNLNPSYFVIGKITV